MFGVKGKGWSGLVGVWGLGSSRKVDPVMFASPQKNRKVAPCQLLSALK